MTKEIFEEINEKELEYPVLSKHILSMSDIGGSIRKDRKKDEVDVYTELDAEIDQIFDRSFEA